MARIGYARTSTTDQNLAAQIAALKAAGCEVIREEQKSGASLAGRPQLDTILDFIHAGETLVVTRIDRLARSLRDLQLIVDRLKAKGAHLSRPNNLSIPRPPQARPSLTCSASLPNSRPICGGNVRLRGSHRQKAWHLQRTAAEIDRNEIISRLKQGHGPTRIARDLGISRGTVYQVRKGR